MKAWVEMSRAEKSAAVRPLLLDGHSYSEIAARLGATSRNAIGTIATALRQKGAIALKPRKSMLEPKSARVQRSPQTPTTSAKKAPAAEKPTAPKRDKLLRKSASGAIDVAPMRGPKNPHHNDFKARAERRASSPGLSPALVAGEPERAIGEPAPASRGLKLVELTASTCKWPHGDPLAEDFRFCGHDVTQAPYCAYHNRLAYTAPTIRHRAEIRSAERKFA